MTLAAFTPDQRDFAHRLLAAKVARMMGRKLEEGDWSEVYCRAKDIPNRGWSNLNIDVVYQGLGVEQKMLCYRSDADITRACGDTFMHPAATRAFRIPTGRISADRAMREILAQYVELIRQRTEKVRADAPGCGEPDMRTGWLLWQESLRQFLYFEERMQVPNPSDYRATWVESGGGARLASRNLWIYDRATDRKRFSVTTAAGAKIQPYFDVPLPDDPNLYIFTVIGEIISAGRIRCWVSQSTLEDLRSLLGSVDAKTIERAVREYLTGLPVAEGGPPVEQPAAAIEITSETYELLLSRLPGVNDDHCFQLLIRTIRNRR